jgi:predicted alpha/beta superfamily hydrolase
MYRKILISICIVLPMHLFAQSDICIGKSDTLYSSVLNEKRAVWIHLPKSYEDSASKRYPVIYLLDGDLFFHALVAIQRSYSGGRQPLMPECIIVGVMNTDRTRDLTPTKSAFRRDGKRYDGDPEMGGGSESFTDYLCKELRSKINKAYRTNGTNILVGHSFGGLFALTTLFRHPELFDSYVALDPSFWWDNGVIYHIANQYIANSVNIKKLFVGVAVQLRADTTNIHWQVADNLKDKILSEADKNGLQVIWKDFSDETHGTIPFVGMANAFKTLFK